MVFFTMCDRFERAMRDEGLARLCYNEATLCQPPLLRRDSQTTPLQFTAVINFLGYQPSFAVVARYSIRLCLTTLFRDNPLLVLPASTLCNSTFIRRRPAFFNEHTHQDSSIVISKIISAKANNQFYIIFVKKKKKKKKNTGRYIRHIIDQYKYKEYIEIKI